MWKYIKNQTKNPPFPREFQFPSRKIKSSFLSSFLSYPVSCPILSCPGMWECVWRDISWSAGGERRVLSTIASVRSTAPATALPIQQNTNNHDIFFIGSENNLSVKCIGPLLIWQGGNIQVTEKATEADKVILGRNEHLTF